MRTRTCVACGHTEQISGKRWDHACPKAGTLSGKTCEAPHTKADGTTYVCGQPLVWRSGPFGTFHGCVTFPQCKGKVCAPRGQAVTKAQTTPAGENNGVTYAPGYTPEAAAYEQTTQTNDSDTTPNPENGPVITETEVESKLADRPKATDSAPPAPLPNDPGAALWAMIQAHALYHMQKVAGDAAVQAVAQVEGKHVTVTHKVNGEVKATVKPGAHKLVHQLIEAVTAGFNNLFLFGPAGSGKTTLAKSLAESLGLPFVAISCSAGMSESKVEGRMVPHLTKGEDLYRSTNIVDAYQTGAVILIDEVDAADPNLLLVLNAATANGTWYTPGGEVTRHEKTVFVLAGNTTGTGADRVYVGRNQLDGAFLDRFVGATIEVDYDTDLEARILTNAKALSRVWEVRSKVQSLKLRRIAGTRMVQAVAKWMAFGKSVDQALDLCTKAWTPDERQKCGIAAA